MVDSGNTYGDRVSRLVSWGHWFTFFNIVAAMLIGTRYVTNAPWPETIMGQVYLVISWLGHFSFLVFALYLISLFPLSFVIPSRKLYRFISVCFASVGLTLLLLDTQAYQQIHLHLNPIVWELLLEKDHSSIATELQQLFIVLPVIFLLQIVLSEWIWRKQRKLANRRVGRGITQLFFVSFIASHLIYIWADASLYTPITAQKANFPLSYPMTAKSFMQKYGLLDRDEYAKRRIESQLEADHVSYPIEPLKYNSRGKQYNVLMVMVDSLCEDQMYQMPNLSDFAADNITFFNHYATSNNRMSLFGLFYGIPSSYENGIQGQQTAPLFLDVMKQQGYNFGLFTANHIQDNYYRTLMDQTNDVGIPRYDPETYRDKQALADWQIWLKDNASSPWFSYIELATIKNFEDYEVANKEAPPAEQLKSAYSAAATELDQTIAPLFDYLKEQALLENTIVIITSNHGTEFNETNTNSWGANTNYSRYQLGVPLVIHWPGKEPDLLMHKSSHFDISVTLLQDLLGVASNPQEFSSGRNLFDKSKRKWVLASSANEIAVITDEVTTVVDKYGNYKVYDSNYKRQKEAKTKLSILMQGLSELKRFYSREQE